MADYPPGSPVTIYGAGFAPGETVTIQVQETDSDDTWLTDTADSTGSFTNTSFQIQDNDGGVIFVLTATGQTSGLTAQYKFTDHITGVTLGAQTPNPVLARGTRGNHGATYTVACTTSGGTAVTYSLVNPAGTAGTPGTPWTLPTGVSVSFTPSASITSCATAVTLTIENLVHHATDNVSLFPARSGHGHFVCFLWRKRLGREWIWSRMSHANRNCNRNGDKDGNCNCYSDRHRNCNCDGNRDRYGGSGPQRRRRARPLQQPGPQRQRRLQPQPPQPRPPRP